jgi:hypothetical protein
MAKITHFTDDNLKLLRIRIAAALKPIELEFEVKLDLKPARYSPNNFTARFEGSVKSSSGIVVTKESEDFKRNAFMYGLHPNDLNRIFLHKGERFTIVGLATRSRKYPIICKKPNSPGHTKFSAPFLKQILSEQK